MRPMISIRGKISDRPDGASQLVSDHDLRRAKPADPPLQKPSDGFRITLRLHGNVEHVPIRVDCSPEPELHANDWNKRFDSNSIYHWRQAYRAGYVALGPVRTV